MRKYAKMAELVDAKASKAFILLNMMSSSLSLRIYTKISNKREKNKRKKRIYEQFLFLFLLVIKVKISKFQCVISFFIKL